MILLKKTPSRISYLSKINISPFLFFWIKQIENSSSYFAFHACFGGGNARLAGEFLFCGCDAQSAPPAEVYGKPGNSRALLFLCHCYSPFQNKASARICRAHPNGKHTLLVYHILHNFSICFSKKIEPMQAQK